MIGDSSIDCRAANAFYGFNKISTAGNPGFVQPMDSDMEYLMDSGMIDLARLYVLKCKGLGSGL